jgi:hypothetical protein
MDAVPDHPAPPAGPPGPGRFTGGTVTLRFHLSDELESSPDIGDLLCEIDHGLIAIFRGRAVQVEASAQCRHLTVPLPARAGPAPCFPRVMNSSGISRIAPDHPETATQVRSSLPTRAGFQLRGFADGCAQDNPVRRVRLAGLAACVLLPGQESSRLLTCCRCVRSG